MLSGSGKGWAGICSSWGMRPVAELPTVVGMATPHRAEQFAEGDSTDIPLPARRTVATAAALSRLRRLSNNADLADRVPNELWQAGFGCVLFSFVPRNMWCPRSVQAIDVTELPGAVLHARVVAPVCVWQTPVGLLHVVAPTESGDVGPEDRDLLGVFAEGLGAILERNIVQNKIQALSTCAEDHRQAIDALTRFGTDSSDGHH